MYYFDRNDVRTTSIQYYSVLQSTTPVLLRITKYYLVLLQYYSVLQSTTPILQSITLYCKVLLQYYSVLQTYYSSTTPYYKVLLQYYKVLLCTTKYYSSTTSTETTSERRPSSTTSYYKVLLQYYFVLQSTTSYYKVLLQYYSVLQTYYKVLLQYYSVLRCTTPVLLRTTNVLLCTTKYYSERNDVRTTSIQYYSVLQSSRKASKTSISCEASSTFQGASVQTSISCQASSTFQGTSFQNEHFVRGFLNFSRNKLPKRAFRARLPQLFKEQASKTSISCEASSTFQGTSFQNEHFVRGFLNFSRNKLPKRAFRVRLPQLFKRQASKTSISCETSATFQATSFQNEHFVRDFHNFSRNKLPKRAFRTRLPQLFNQGASKVLRLPRKTRK